MANNKLAAFSAGLVAITAALVGTTIARADATAGFGPRSAYTMDTDYPIPTGAVFVSPGGNDGASGNQAHPLRTIAAGLHRAPVGGTVVLRAGDYRESIQNISKRITVQPFPHEDAWMNGADVVSAWQRDGRGWRSTTWRSPLCRTCYNPAAITATHPLAGDPNQVFVNGTPLTQVAGDGALTATSFYVAADNSVVIGANPAGALVEASSRWKALQLNDPAQGSVIRGIGFRRYAPVWDESQLAAVILNTANVTFEHDTLTQIAGTALAATRPGARILTDTVARNGYRGMVANRADGLVIDDSRFDTNNTAGFDVGSCGGYCTVAGAKITHSRDISVTDTSFYDNDGAGLWCDLGCIGLSASGNSVTDNSWNGIYYEVSSQASITDNLIAGNVRGVKISGSDHVTLHGNTIADNQLDLGLYDDPRSPSTDGWSAANGLTWNTTNTVVTGNAFTASRPGTTGLVLDTNHTVQENAWAMVSSMTGNSYQLGTSPAHFNWCGGGCYTYTSRATFDAATRFGH